jgi:choline kinase
MTKPTLVILAAGMGSRYGGLKQMDTFTPNGDTIIDFSVYDALQAGFGKFVFIIRKSFENEFKEIFNKKLKGRAQVDYVFQELDSVPAKYVNPERTKPWGTGHALLLAKDVVKENFAIINGDDFYGKEAFEVMARSLAGKNINSFDFNTMAYLLKNTVSDHGYVSRGECKVDEDGYLIDVTERTHIEKINGKLMLKDNNGKMLPIDGNTVVSMNFWGFTPNCFEFGNQLLKNFLEANKENLKSDSKWFGVTYKEDKKFVQKAIRELKEQGIYPSKLW